MTKSNLIEFGTATLSQTETPSTSEYMLELEKLVAIARSRSPFYAQLYRHLPSTGWQLSDLPLADPNLYWKDNHDLKTWPVLTGTIADALVFKTGGTTGGGKLSVYTRDEWRAFVTSFGRSISSHLQPGDRVANLFFAGDLYASFLFIHGALLQMPIPVCEYPFTGTTEPQALTAQITQYEINVLAGVPGKLLHYATTLDTQGVQLPGITTVLYGGESLFAEQLRLLKRVFPNARVASIGCASVDAGLIGSSFFGSTQGEHRVFEPETIVEIIDETSGLPITETNRNGMLVVTNLTRTLMPLIRYPVGDTAVWCEPQGGAERKFMLQGRSSLGHRLRVGYVTLFPDELAILIAEHVGQYQWQLLIEHDDSIDHIILRIAYPGNDNCAEAIIDALKQRDSAIVEMMDGGQLKIAIHWCQQADLTSHPRTGKLLRVIDQRSYQCQSGSAA